MHDQPASTLPNPQTDRCSPDLHLHCPSLTFKAIRQAMKVMLHSSMAGLRFGLARTPTVHMLAPQRCNWLSLLEPQIKNFSGHLQQVLLTALQLNGERPLKALLRKCPLLCVMLPQEYMAGGTLKQLVTREMLGNGRRTYSNKQAVDICLQMARGLRSVTHPARHHLGYSCFSPAHQPTHSLCYHCVIEEQQWLI